MKKTSIFLNMKRWKTLGLFSLAILAASSTYAQDVTTGLQLYYSFDNVSGGSVPDDSGKGLIGSEMGSPTVVAGNSGNALYFATQSDYVQLPNDITTSLTDFTIAAWVNVDKLQWWPRIFDFGTGQTNYMFLSQVGNGYLRFAIRTATVDEQQINSTTAITTGTWVHVAVTVQGNTGTMYINGVAVGTNTNMTLTPSSLGSTTQNYIAKSQFPDPALVGAVDEFRVYNRALTNTDIVALTGLDELKKQQTALDLGAISNVTSNLTLPTTMGTKGVTVRWATSNASMIDTLGVLVSRPDKYNTPVLLTATLSQTLGGKVYTLTKQFTATVSALNPVATSELLADWNFASGNIFLDGDTIKVTDASGTGLVGKLMDVARIRTIGNTTKYNVLDLGNNQGYFDMGSQIGEAVYSLSDFTMAGYFRMDETYTGNSDWGNNLFSFSNTENDLSDPKGTMYACLGKTNYAITSGAWNSGGETYLNPYKTPTTGTWHHYAYTQNGSVGTIYFDGAVVTSGSVAAYPFNTLRIDGVKGTRFNWIGRPPYGAPDSYLRKTLVYGLQMYNVALTANDMINTLMVPDTLAALNQAYAENPDYVSTSITTEVNNLSIGDTTAVSANLTLPTKGTLDPTVSIAWASNHNEIISTTGVVTSPSYHAYNVKLTATLSQGVQTKSKVFNVTVLPKAGTEFTNNLVVKYDFNTVTNDTVVTDGAEKHFTGIVKNDAKIRTIGTSATGTYKVLSLGDSLNTKGYFDMGTEVGKVMYGLSDYTVGAYYRIDPAYTALSSNGNFLWNFSNSKDIINDPTGYMIGSLRNQAATITGGNWGGEQTVALGALASTGGWHHFLYTQKDTIGTIYVDGMVAQSGTVKQRPINTLVKDQRLGTLYNWIGRSCYTGDVYLRQALVADFRVYSKALTEEEIQTGLAINDMMGALDAAYAANTGMSVASVKASQYKVIASEGLITIQGLNGGEKVSLFDITGRQFKVTTPSSITVKSGMYIVKVNDYVTKVIVK
ncbi:MAG: LamG-like jellyroll fold domain-containing protein [Bacteroidota bacterium]|nr:LamG-like jellyroll fold domain-containing protein [Bacteroidota bacterium]